VIHQFNPAMAPDTEFVPGDLSYLVPGNEGRMLDRRRTPIRVVKILPATGTWVCEVRAFEDVGAHWELPIESVRSYQFALGSPRVSVAELRRLRAAARKFDRHTFVPLDKRARKPTERRIAALRLEVAQWLERHSKWRRAGGLLDRSSREGDRMLWQDLESFMRERGHWEIERQFATTFASHPDSGEIVKGHEMVLAQLGLADYHGKIIRNPGIFEPPWTIHGRKEHILTRLAFVREVFTAAGLTAPTLYRGVWSESALTARPRGALFSATFSLPVAISLFGTAAHGGHAALYRQAVPIERVLMTYLETEALNQRFKEAEAVLIEDPSNLSF
jgi:hypothetical protein